MTRFITVANWTEQGIKNIKDSPKRFEAVRGMAASFGGTLEAGYTMGQYGIVIVTEFPNDDSAARFLYSVGRLGNFRTHTLKAFTEAEGLKLINSLQ